MAKKQAKPAVLRAQKPAVPNVQKSSVPIKAIKIVRDPKEQKRIRQVVINRREELWYDEPFREALLAKLSALEIDPMRHRTKSYAIIAEPNGGKSSLVNRYMVQNPPIPTSEKTMISCIFLEMTHYPLVEDFSRALLKVTRAPEKKKHDETHHDRMTRFVEHAREVGLKLIFLDEFHDCADTTGKGKPFLRCIKGLLLKGFCVVPMGTEELAAVISRDAQLASRLNFASGRLPRIKDASLVKALMEEISGFPEEILDDAVKYIVEQTKGVFGHVLDLIEGTAIDYGNLKLESLEAFRQEMDVLDSIA
jgi:Bacterial TniB protein